MLIIIEGNDATGKTQLAEHLVQDHQFIYHHFGPPNKHPIDEWGTMVEAYQPGFGVDVVMDRLHWGELVYAPHYRGRTQLGYPGFEWMERAIQAKGGVTILAEGDPEKILERVIALDDDYVVKELDHLTRLSTLYKETWRRARTPVFTHNFDEDREVNLNPVFAMARSLERAATQQDEPEYLGSLGAGILFVGDVVGGGDGDIIDLPFAAYDNQGCGYYLFETLLQIPMLEEYGIINAYKAYDGSPRDLIPIWEWLDEPRVVALGNNASDVLTEQGIAHGVAYHPQWVKRFKHGQQKQYAASIWQAALTLNDQRRMVT